jgi:SAM-dependent methyltransferase
MRQPAHYQSLEFARVAKLFAGFAKGKDRPLRVLDFGCGRGRYLDCFSSLGCDVTGVDANPAYVAEARRKGFSAQSSEGFLRSDASGFDVIFLSHVIEHLTPENLVQLIPRLCGMLLADGRLVIVTPTPGERFYHDFSHVRPYLPQSIRHAFGQVGMPISYGESSLIELSDVYFFKDPYRTRLWRTFYVGTGVTPALTRSLNAGFDAIWQISGGRVGVVASWLGVYQLKPKQERSGPSPARANGAP